MLVTGNTILGFPLLLKSNLFQIRFSSYFGKCEIKANASLKPDFSPIPLAKIHKIILMATLFIKKMQNNM
jgi:hypothetical protein